MGSNVTKKKLQVAIIADDQHAKKDNLAIVIKDLEFELSKAATKVFRSDNDILVVINYIEVEEEHVMVSASFHGGI